MKQFICLLLAALLLLSLVFPVFAAAPKIVDEADLVTDEEAAILEARAQELADQYEMDVVIVTVQSLNGQDITNYADDYFDYNGYGIGSRYSGVLLLIAMDTREWAISTCGDAIQAIPDWAIEDLSDAMSSYLSVGAYYYAFSEYLNALERRFAAYIDGQTVDAGDYLRVVVVSLLVGAAVGGIAILVMRGMMNTARAQSGATSYLTAGSFHLSRRLDIFLYSNVSRTRRAQSSSSTHRGSSGRSHGGGRGRF